MDSLGDGDTFDPYILKTEEAGGFLWVQGQPGLHNKTLSQNKQN